MLSTTTIRPIFHNHSPLVSCLCLLVMVIVVPAQDSLSETPTLPIVYTMPTLQFTTPAVGSVLRGDLCTLALECEGCHSPLSISAFFLNSQGERDSVQLAMLTRPPYQLLWDISAIPDQFLGDLTLQADLHLMSGDTLRTRRDGIFIIRRPAPRPRAILPYAPRLVPGKASGSGITIAADNNKALSINAELLWNETGLECIVSVKDDAFSTQVPADLLKLCGITLLLEPSITNRPVPDEKTFAFFVPLLGNPIRIFYQSEFSQNEFNLLRSTIPFTDKTSIKQVDGKGFTAAIHIARELFGNTLPDSMGCNILVTTLAGDRTVSYSWTNGYGRQMLSPATWGILRFAPRPFYYNKIFLWLLAYSLGCALIIIGYALYTHRDPHTRTASPIPESATAEFEAIKKLVESNLTNREFTIVQAAEQSNLKPGAINAITRKVTHLAFRDYLYQCRIELAKERLRSTHSSEVSIAEQCAFGSVSEMEHFFQKFHHTSPYNFRKEYQIG